MKTPSDFKETFKQRAEFQECLDRPEGAYAREYLRGRGLDQETTTGFRIGFAPAGRTVQLDEKAGPKYLNSPETPTYSKSRVLFNLDQAKESIRKLDYAILVEGQMDSIAVFALGSRNVVASYGTAFTAIQAKLLGRFSKNIVINFDPEAAGARATERTLALLVEEGFQIKVLRLEPGFDPDLFIRHGGKDAYERALFQSQRYFDYLIESAGSQFPVKSVEGKVKLAVTRSGGTAKAVPKRRSRMRSGGLIRALVWRL
jgi:DNA primase catalytic core